MNNYDTLAKDIDTINHEGSHSHDELDLFLLGRIAAYTAQILDILQEDSHKSYNQITKEAADRL